MSVPSKQCVFQKEDGIHLFVCVIFVISDLVSKIKSVNNNKLDNTNYLLLLRRKHK